MARMVPPIVTAETPASERRVFEALKTASESTEWTVLHSLGLSSAWTGEFGEIDFVVIIPRVGIICIEVKGGTVAHDNGVWTARRHDAPAAEILKRSPFRQAQEGMWKLKHAIKAKFGHGSLEAKCPLGWSVILPDVACPPVTPEFTREEVIDESDLTRDVSGRLRTAPSIVQLANRRDLVEPSQGTCRRILDFLRPNFESVEMVSTHVWDTERRIQALTEEQYGVLDAIDENPICLIKGPAGTGKTNLAIECARRLSLAGKRVLLACYNRNLGDWLRDCVGKFSTQIVAGHIHGLLRDRIGRSSLACDLPAHGEAEADDLYGRLYFELGALAIYEIGERFDAVLVDENQDMDIARLADVVRVWTDGIESPRVILFGDFIRQALYGTPNAGSQAVLATFPGIPVFNLAINCRNTRRIAVQTDLMCGFTGSKVSGKQPEGDPVEVFFANGASSTKRLEQIVTVLRKSGHRPEDVVILGPRRRENSVLAGLGSIGGWRLRDVGVAAADDLTYATIHSFKGLERPVVIVIEAGASDPAETDSLLYVAMSRARVRLFVICREEARPVIEKRLVYAIAAMPSVA